MFQHDWQLRAAFFRAIVGVAAYVGWQSVVILKPLLQQVVLTITNFIKPNGQFEHGKCAHLPFIKSPSYKVKDMSK